MHTARPAGQPRILVVDDEREIADLVEIHLLNEGCDVLKAASGTEALARLAAEPVDLVILDIMMPGMDGLETCRRIRRSRDVPVIMLSAKSEDMDKVVGLGCGADDYLAKPFHVMELMARVKSQLRRYFGFASQAGADAARRGLVIAGGLVIDEPAHTASLDGRDVKLTPTEFRILALLAAHPGRVFSAEEIFRTVWQDRYYDSNNTVMVHIRKIREKIEEDPRKPALLKTVWGVGYKVEG